MAVLARVQRCWSRRCASHAAIAFFLARRARRAAKSVSNPPETPLPVLLRCIWLDMAALAIWSASLLSPTGFCSHPGSASGWRSPTSPSSCASFTLAPGPAPCLAFPARIAACPPRVSDRMLLLQRARASRPVFDLFLHRLLRTTFHIFRWEVVILRDGLPLSTLDDSFCFLRLLCHHSSSSRWDPVPTFLDRATPLKRASAVLTRRSSGRHYTLVWDEPILRR